MISILFILETLICSSHTLQFVFICLSRVTAPTVDTRQIFWRQYHFFGQFEIKWEIKWDFSGEHNVRGRQFFPQNVNMISYQYCSTENPNKLHVNELLHRWRLNVWSEWIRISRFDRNKNVVSGRREPAHFLRKGLEGCVP